MCSTVPLLSVFWRTGGAVGWKIYIGFEEYGLPQKGTLCKKGTFCRKGICVTCSLVPSVLMVVSKHTRLYVVSYEIRWV